MRIKTIKAQDIKSDDLVIFYDDPDGDGDEYTTYKVEIAQPDIVLTPLNRYEVISLEYRELESGELTKRQVHPEYPFRILIA
jgi:hypothetical protein